jgi:hypothetical protein
MRLDDPDEHDSPEEHSGAAEQQDPGRALGHETQVDEKEEDECDETDDHPRPELVTRVHEDLSPAVGEAHRKINRSGCRGR